MKKDKHGSNFQRRWSKTKNAETELVICKEFQRQAEGKIEFEGDSGQKNLNGSLSEEEKGHMLREDKTLMKIP